MSRKHFRAIAAAIAEIKGRAERRRTAERMAVVCASLNPRFNFTTFMTACGC